MVQETIKLTGIRDHQELLSPPVFTGFEAQNYISEPNTLLSHQLLLLSFSHPNQALSPPHPPPNFSTRGGRLGLALADYRTKQSRWRK
jgi:hypothetical protein